jgi:hypothetical protein
MNTSLGNTGLLRNERLSANLVFAVNVADTFIPTALSISKAILPVFHIFIPVVSG